ncbi:MAG: ice-binding family protein [Candidatus Binatus sp.]|uniref:ice-binding family protein n=1 Tax=Candidatus Binatus sp. TaxID=2811406 RepID=UPI0027183EB7|nr:ice-binding family protein [Candidatus Binatus sp.]MDO8433550.1 ice-binding family protein [Candidatus Binatus sp.]
MKLRGYASIVAGLTWAVAGTALSAHAGGLGAARHFAVLATDGGVRIGNAASISPGATGLIGGTTVRLGNGSGTGASVIAGAASARAITVGNGSRTQGQCVSGGGSITIGHASSCRAGLDNGGQNPLLNELSAAVGDAASAASELGALNPTQNLQPINLPHGGSATIALAPGFNVIKLPSITAGNGARIVIDGLEDAYGAINVAGDLSLGNGARILLKGGITADELIWNVGGNARFGNAATVKGTVLADMGNCSAGNGVTVAGALICGTVATGDRMRTDYTWAFLPRTIYVRNFDAGRVTEYPVGSSGNVAPSAVIEGDATQLSVGSNLGPIGIALDGSGNIYAQNRTPLFSSIEAYAAGASGNVPPIASIDDGENKFGIALDAAGNIYTASIGPCVFPALCGSITEYSAAAGHPLLNTILGFGQLEPTGVAVDAKGNIYVANNRDIRVYAAGSSGDVPPIAKIVGDAEHPLTARGIALDAAANIYTVNFDSVTKYAAGSSGFVAPLATIQGDKTMIASPYAIAIAGGRIYVANGSGGPSCGALNCGSITVYKQSSSGNVAPVAVIVGPSSVADLTELRTPGGIAIGD